MENPADSVRQVDNILLAKQPLKSLCLAELQGKSIPSSGTSHGPRTIRQAEGARYVHCQLWLQTKTAHVAFNKRVCSVYAYPT